jgi:prevent-host-death family protein
MRDVGVRELKGALSETLRAVGRGEEVRVTSRGRPIAYLLPAGPSPRDAQLRGLIAAGRVVPPAQRRPTEAPRPVRSPRSASALVLAERESDR